MKHLILALVIALLSTPAATTAWSQQTEQAGPTEQETKDFIVETMGKCNGTNEVKFEGSNLHLSSMGRTSDIAGTPKIKIHLIVPVQKLKSVTKFSADATVLLDLQIKPFHNLEFTCKATESACIQYFRDDRTVKSGGATTEACFDPTNKVLAKAFNHLIKIYDAERPKPLFE